MEQHITLLELRQALTDAANDVQFRGHRIVVTRHGKPAFALVPIEDMQQLKDAEVVEVLRTFDPAEYVPAEALLAQYRTEAPAVPAVAEAPVQPYKAGKQPRVTKE